MKRVTVEEVESRPSPLNVHDVRRPLSRELGAEHVPLVEYELDPGDQFSGGLHAHQYSLAMQRVCTECGTEMF